MNTPETQESPQPQLTDAHAYGPIIGLFALIALISYFVNWQFLPGWLRYVWLVMGTMQLVSARTIKVQNPKSITSMYLSGGVLLLWAATNFYR